MKKGGRLIVALVVALTLPVILRPVTPVVTADHGLNNVWLDFVTSSGYRVAGEDFTNGEVTGIKTWASELRNYPRDITGLPVINAKLSLASSLAFDRVNPLLILTQMGPPAYQWTFGDVTEGSSPRFGSVGFRGYPSVTFVPGFDASRSADKTVFTENTAQTLIIKVTPRQEMTVFRVEVHAAEDDKIKPVITSPTTDLPRGIILTPRGDHLTIEERLPVTDAEYTYIVTIGVVLKVPSVEFMPAVKVGNPGEALVASTTTGSSVSYTMPDVGTWTWSADGSYQWIWRELPSRDVHFPDYSKLVIAAEVDINPDTLNVRSQSDRNALTGYIEFPAGYDVVHINVATVRLKAAGTWVAAQPSPLDVADYDKDGVGDLMVKFDRQAVINALADKTGKVALTISGALNDGRRFIGTVTINVINPGK